MDDQARNQLNRIEATLTRMEAKLRGLEGEFREFRKTFADLEITVDAAQLFNEGLSSSEPPPDIDWDALLKPKPDAGAPEK